MKKFAFVLACLLLAPGAAAQQEDLFSDLLTSFEAYADLPREVAYVHLNKSVLIKGEELGFTAYVMDKDHKRPSGETRNLYCVISDSANRTLRSKLLLIEDGVGHGSFRLDSLFTTGTYVFRAYTNWMLNFSEPNYYEQHLDIIDPETDEFLPGATVAGAPDVQFLPEGGHAVDGLEVVYGVVAKDPSGFGIPHLQGSITDRSGQELTRFKVNPLGIGRFGLLLDKAQTYYARFQYGGEEYKVPLPPGAPEGIVMRLTDLKDAIALSMEMVPGPRMPRERARIVQKCTTW